jgi:hypothetical protein
MMNTILVTKYEKKIGFSGNDAVGIILVNAQTGEIKEHSIVTTPSCRYSTD